MVNLARLMSSSSKLNIQQQQNNELQNIIANSINNGLFSKLSPKKKPVLLTSFRYQSFNEDNSNLSLNNDSTALATFKDDSSFNTSNEEFSTLNLNDSKNDLSNREYQLQKDFLPNLNKSKLNYFSKNNYNIMNENDNNNYNNNSSEAKRLSIIEQEDSSIFLKKYALKRHHSAPQSDVKWLQVLIFISKKKADD